MVLETMRKMQGSIKAKLEEIANRIKDQQEKENQETKEFLDIVRHVVQTKTPEIDLDKPVTRAVFEDILNDGTRREQMRVTLEKLLKNILKDTNDKGILKIDSGKKNQSSIDYLNDALYKLQA